jgi:hypothetical protein
LKNFCNHSFNSLDGIGDHINAENWLNDMEELLSIIECIEELNVAYTAFKLSREAKGWWQVKKMLLVMDLGPEKAVTWTIFKDEFNQHVSLRVVQNVRARKFMDLI